MNSNDINNELEKLSIEELKMRLLRMKIQFEPRNQSKDYFLDLYLKNLNNENSINENIQNKNFIFNENKSNIEKKNKAKKIFKDKENEIEIDSEGEIIDYIYNDGNNNNLHSSGIKTISVIRIGNNNINDEEQLLSNKNLFNIENRLIKKFKKKRKKKTL